MTRVQQLAYDALLASGSKTTQWAVGRCVRRTALLRLKYAATVNTPERKLIFGIIEQAVSDADGAFADVTPDEQRDAQRFFHEDRFEILCVSIRLNSNYARRTLAEFFPWANKQVRA